jgi:hypothetical protein
MYTYILSYAVSLRPIIVQSYQPRQELPSGFSPSDFPTKMSLPCFISHKLRATIPDSELINWKIPLHIWLSNFADGTPQYL